MIRLFVRSLIPHAAMVRRCRGCSSTDYHTHDTTPLFRLWLWTWS